MWTAVLTAIPVIATVICLVHKKSGDDKTETFGNFLHNVLYAFAAFLNEGEELNRVFHKRTEMPILAFSSLLHENKKIQ